MIGVDDCPLPGRNNHRLFPGFDSLGRNHHQAAGESRLRQYGSGNIGATNVLRTAGWKTALPSLVLDVAKGAAAVLFAGLIIGKNYIMVGQFGFGPLLGEVLAGLAAIAGHTWSIFLGFKGGKGVSTFSAA